MTSASDNLMASTAHHTTYEQDAALDTAWQALELQGARDAYPDTPDARYAAVDHAAATVPDFAFLAGRIAGAHGAPVEAGLAGDPLTQILHDVYSEAQAEAEAEQDAAEAEAETLAEHDARWRAQCDREAEWAARDHQQFGYHDV